MKLSLFWILLLISQFPSFAQAQQEKMLSKESGVKIIADAQAQTDNSRKPSCAFDGSTTNGYYYRSNADTHAWVGLELPEPYVVTKVRWYNVSGTYNMSFSTAWDMSKTTVAMPYSQMAVFEGANQPDFSDAVPLYLVNDAKTTSHWSEATINVSQGFKYVRYVGPNSSYGRIAELEFYGIKGAGDKTQYYQPTNLPVVVVHTKETTITTTTTNWRGQTTTKTETVAAGTDPKSKSSTSDNSASIDLNASYSFISQDGQKILSISSDGTTFRERGNTSRHFGKKPYRIKLGSKEKVFGADYKAKKWTLVPAFDDKTFMRNIVGFKVNEALGQEYTPYCRPVDVFVNGEFKGQYQFCDQVEANKNRIDIEEIESTTSSTGKETWPSSAYDFGWFFEVDKLANQEPSGTWFNSALGIPVAIKSPDSDENVSQYNATIKSHFNKLETAARNGKVEQYLDTASFVRHFLAVEFVGNTDGYHSIFMHKHQGDDRIFTGPLWDLNLTLDNEERMAPLANRTRWSYNETWADAGNIRTLMQNIFNYNPTILQEAKDVWANVRQSKALTTEALVHLVDSLEVKLDASQKLNYVRWNMLGKRIFYEPTQPGTYAAEVQILRNSLQGRVSWMDGMLGTKQQTTNLTISSAGWASIYLPMAFTVPQGVTCYEVTGFDAENSRLLLHAVTNTMANKPYLIKGPAGTYKITGYTADNRDARTLGLLTGTNRQIYAPVGSYVMQMQGGQVCFYRVYDRDIPVGAQRAYLNLPELASNTPVRFFLEDEEAGLSEMADDRFSEVAIYDMAGHLLQRISEGQWSEADLLRQHGPGMYVVRMGNETKKIVVKN